MLRTLSIRDFVLVESLEIDFDAGLTALTGETGAGKSILVDALSLVLGDRAGSGVVRNGAKRAEISAEFEVRSLHGVNEWLAVNGLEADSASGYCLLRRVVEAEGRSRAFVNGSPVTLVQLNELGEQLVDIHGQHAHHALLKTSVQRQLLDMFAGSHIELMNTLNAWQDWQAAMKRLTAAQEESGARLLEKEGLESALAETGPVLDDLRAWEELQAEHQRQAHMSGLIDSCSQVLALLDDEENGLIRQLGQAHAVLHAMHQMDTSLSGEQAMVESALGNLEEARHSLSRYADRLSVDPERLADLDRRMAEVHRVSRKHRLTVPELLERYETWVSRLEALAAEQDIEAIAAEADTAEKSYSVWAQKLSDKRKEASKILSEKVTAAMSELALGEGRFAVQLVPCQPQSHGQEEVAFLVASHASLALGPLEKVASGGELSRIGLAIQTVLSGRAGVPTLIFDEVDVGVGGAVAEAVGRRLVQVAENCQVLVVTHLPQVASFASRHLRVSKLAGEDRVVSQVSPLAGDERVLEIARMLGGQEITKTTQLHAREMLDRAKPGKTGRKTA